MINKINNFAGKLKCGNFGAMKITCKHCGDTFTAHKSDIDMLNDGLISEITPCCDECFNMQNECAIANDYFHSDADSGL